MAASAPTATFAVELKDNVSGAAMRGAASLEKLRATIEEDQKALRAMQAAMARLKGGTSTNIAAFKSLRAQISAKKAAVASAESAFVELGGTFESVGGSAGTAQGGIADLLESLQGAPGPLGGIVSKLSAMKGLLGAGAIAAGVVAIAVGLVALTAAAVAATASLLRYGLAQSDARRSELLRLEGLTTLRRHQGLTAGSATVLQSAIDRVSDSTALGRSEVAGYAEQLHRMGLRGGELQDALEGVAITSSVQGDAMARGFAGMSAAAIRTGGSVRRLADDVRARLGGVAQRQARGLDRQMERLRSNVARLFSGLRIEGFLNALHEVTSLFSQSTASGRAMKQIFEALFNPLVGGMESAGPVARRFFQGLILGALRITVAMVRVRNWFRRTFGASDILAGFDSQRAAFYAGIAVLGLLAAAAVATALAVGVLAVAVTAVVAGLLLLAAIPAAIPLALGAAALAVWTFWDDLTSIDWGSAGRGLIDGFVKGLRSGVRLVGDTVRGIADSATGALRDALQIRSPSRVFARLGLEIPRGLAQGVERGMPAAMGAVDRVVSVPTEVPAQAGGASALARTGGAPMSVSIGDVHIHTDSADGAGLARSFVDQVAQLLEGAAIQMGAPA